MDVREKADESVPWTAGAGWCGGYNEPGREWDSGLGCGRTLLIEDVTRAVFMPHDGGERPVMFHRACAPVDTRPCFRRRLLAEMRAAR